MYTLYITEHKKQINSVLIIKSMSLYSYNIASDICCTLHFTQSKHEAKVYEQAVSVVEKSRHFKQEQNTVNDCSAK